MNVIVLTRNKKIHVHLISREILGMRFKNMYKCEKKCKNVNLDFKMVRLTFKKIIMKAKIQ